MVLPLLWGVYLVAGTTAGRLAVGAAGRLAAAVAARYITRKLGGKAAQQLGTPVSTHRTREMAARQAAELAAKNLKNIKASKKTMGKGPHKEAKAAAKKEAKTTKKQAKLQDITGSGRSRRAGVAVLAASEVKPLYDIASDTAKEVVKEYKKYKADKKYRYGGYNTKNKNLKRTKKRRT